MNKICNKCGKELPIEEFSVRKYKDNINREACCKKCILNRRKVWEFKNKEKLQAYHKKYRDNLKYKKIGISEDKEYKLKSLEIKEYLNNHPEINRVKYRYRKLYSTKHKENYMKNIDRKRKSSIEYYNKNKEKIIKRQVMSISNRRKIDPSFKLKYALSRRMYNELRSNKILNKSSELLGGSIQEIRNHIEKQFKPGMCWKNWSLRGWHIDHIIPISSFDLTDLEQQKKCFNYKNLQPLWWYENLSKGNKIYL